MYSAWLAFNSSFLYFETPMRTTFLALPLSVTQQQGPRTVGLSLDLRPQGKSQFALSFQTTTGPYSMTTNKIKGNDCIIIIIDYRHTCRPTTCPVKNTLSVAFLI